jgi:hypothetical protein
MSIAIKGEIYLYEKCITECSPDKRFVYFKRCVAICPLPYGSDYYNRCVICPKD